MKISIFKTTNGGLAADVRIPDASSWERIYSLTSGEVRASLNKLRKIFCHADDPEYFSLSTNEAKSFLNGLIESVAGASDSGISYSFSYRNRITGGMHRNVRRASGFSITGRPCMIECGNRLCQIVWSDVPWSSSRDERCTDIRGVQELVDDTGVNIQFHQSGELSEFVQDLRMATEAIGTASDSEQINFVIS